MRTENWISDPVHSELTFKIRHLMISNVSGKFKDFEVMAVTTDDDFSQASITMTANIASLSTENEQRDKHLLSTDFFDAEHFPEMKFMSTNIERAEEDIFIVKGHLSMKGITKSVTLKVQFGGLISTERHGTKAGFTVTGKINRSDWGISFNRILETGGAGLGEEVKIFSDLQMLKQNYVGSVNERTTEG